MTMPARFRCGPFSMRPEWVDENGHINLAHYVTVFDWATDSLWKAIGLGEPYRLAGFGTFAVETHTLYRAELLREDRVTLDSVVVGVDAKRLHVAHTMVRERDGLVSALQELLYLSVDLATRRAAVWPATVLAGLEAAVGTRPEWVGRSVRLGSG